MQIRIHTNAVTVEQKKGAERRANMVTLHREKVEHYYMVEAAAGRPDTVIVLGDENDWIVKELKQTLSEPHRSFVNQVSDDCFSTLIFAFNRWTLYKVLRVAQRQLHQSDPKDPKISPLVEALKLPPTPGSFYCMAISAGKNMVQFPIPE